MVGFVDTLLTPVFGWLFDVPPVLAILFMSAVLGIVGTLLQKYLTNQSKLKRLRADTKKFQKQYKELIKKDPEKAMKLQQQMLPAQMEMMREGFKPLIFTMLPFLLIAWWMGAHFAFEPIAPDMPFTVTAQFADGVGGDATLSVPEGIALDEATKQIVDGAAQWTLRASSPGEYTIGLSALNGVVNDSRPVIVSTSREYAQPVIVKEGVVTQFSIGNKKLTPLGPVSLFGWMPGWIACYILFSIPISLLLRKALNVV